MPNVTAIRVDINCPLDPKSGEILDELKIKEAAETLKEFEDTPVVVMSHQSRPGEADFTSLDGHAKVLRKYISSAEFVDDIIGPTARTKIKDLQNGEVLVLDNVRFLSEELLTGPPEVLARTQFVQRLAPLFSSFVNDAFATAHRSQTSLVGFCEVLPSYAGPLLIKEVTALSKVLSGPDTPVIFLIGGSKAKTKLQLINNLLTNKKADKILVSGILGNYLLRAKGIKLGAASEQRLQDVAILDLAKTILKRHSNAIELPSDVAIKKNGEREEIPIEALPSDYAVLDIGMDTINRYSALIKNAGTVLVNGPAGYFEDPAFAYGTEQLITTIAQSSAFSVIGGGHLTVVARILGLYDRIGHVSTGGGATMAFLAGEPLPVLEALKRAYQRNGREFFI
jgi:phosphoglycerate kinase